LPKEIADYLNKMGARIPNVKPGKATIEYLTKIQASTRFWGTHLPLQVIYLMNNYNLELYLFLFFFFLKKLPFFFGMGGSCRRSIVECIGNYINHS
jgi:preprotein translocase subunit SecY